MRALLGLLGELLATPAQAVRSLGQGGRWGVLALLFLWGVTAQAVADGMGGGFLLGVPATLLAALVGAVATVLCFAGLFHLSASLLGGDGRAAHLVRAFALVFALDIFLPAFALAGRWPAVLAGLAVGVWQLVLLGLAVKEIYRLDAGRAVLALAIPILSLFVALPLLGLVILGLGIMSQG